MVTLPTTPDDEIAGLDATIARLEADAALSRTAIATHQGHIASLEAALALPASQRDAALAEAGRRTGTTLGAARNALDVACHALETGERQLREQRALRDPLRAGRIPEIDDAIARAKADVAKAADIGARARAALVAAHDERKATAARVALVEAKPAELGEVDASIAGLTKTIADAEAAGLLSRGLLEALLARREEAVKLAAAARSQAALEAWRLHQANLARAAREYAAAAGELLRIADANPGLLRMVDSRATLWGDQALGDLVRAADYLAPRP